MASLVNNCDHFVVVGIFQPNLCAVYAVIYHWVAGTRPLTTTICDPAVGAYFIKPVVYKWCVGVTVRDHLVLASVGKDYAHLNAHRSFVLLRRHPVPRDSSATRRRIDYGGLRIRSSIRLGLSSIRQSCRDERSFYQNTVDADLAIVFDLLGLYVPELAVVDKRDSTADLPLPGGSEPRGKLSIRLPLVVLMTSKSPTANELPTLAPRSGVCGGACAGAMVIAARMHAAASRK